MNDAHVLLLGGSGFVGSRIAAHLAANACRVVVPTRNRERARALLTLPTVQVFEADVHDDAQLASLLRGASAVVNAIGVLHGARGRPWGPPAVPSATATSHHSFSPIFNRLAWYPIRK